MHDFDVESAVRQLIDDRDVSQVIHRYAQGVDERDWNLVRACFDPDGWMNGTFGDDRTGDYLPGLIRRVERFGATMHFIGNQQREIHGEVAHTASYGIAHHFADAEGTVEALMVGVRYDDDLARQADGSWWITRRRTHTIWTRHEGRTTP